LARIRFAKSTWLLSFSITLSGILATYDALVANHLMSSRKMFSLK